MTKQTKGWPLDEITARLDQLPVRILDYNFKPFVQEFVQKESAWLSRQDSRIAEIAKRAYKICHQKSIRKYDLTELISVAFLNSECFQKFRNYIPKESNIILDTILLDGIITSEDIYKRFGHVSTQKITHPSWGKNVEARGRSEFSLFLNPDEYHHPIKYKRNWIVFFWPIYLRELAIPLVFPPPYEYNVTKQEIPASPHTSIFLAEQLVQEELPGLIIHLQQKSLKTSKKGRPAISSVKSIGKKLGIREFFPDTEIKSLAHLRSRCLLGLLIQAPELPASINHTHIKTLFDNYFPKSFFAPIHLLNHLKGIDKLGLSWLRGESLSFKNLVQTFPANYWIPFDSLELSLKPQFAQKTNYYIEGMYDLKLDISDPARTQNYSDTMEIYPFFLERLFIWATFQANIYVFAAWGLLDIAYNNQDDYEYPHTIDSPLNRIVAIRLTTLGAYVLGQTDHYESTVKPPFTLELAHDSLSILLTDGDQDRAALAIKSFAKPLGQQRFYTNPNLFLGDCNTPADLQQKISLFRSIFSEDTPPNWMVFFDEMLQKVNPIMEAPEYIAFSLNPENVALLQLIARDPELKSLSLKVEGFMILLLNKDLNRFKKRLQFFGYLLE